MTRLFPRISRLVITLESESRVSHKYGRKSVKRPCSMAQQSSSLAVLGLKTHHFLALTVKSPLPLKESSTEIIKHQNEVQHLSVITLWHSCWCQMCWYDLWCPASSRRGGAKSKKHHRLKLLVDYRSRSGTFGQTARRLQKGYCNSSKTTRCSHGEQISISENMSNRTTGDDVMVTAFPAYAQDKQAPISIYRPTGKIPEHYRRKLGRVYCLVVALKRSGGKKMKRSFCVLLRLNCNFARQRQEIPARPIKWWVP